MFAFSPSVMCSPGPSCDKVDNDVDDYDNFLANGKF